MTKKRYTVTSALLYANGPLHIGHIAGAYLPADIYVRYLKGRGNDVALFVVLMSMVPPLLCKQKKKGLALKKL